MNRINISQILFRYMVWHLMVRVLLALAAIVTIVGIIDTAELFRRVSDKQGVSSITVLAMEAMKMPSTIPELLPFGVLIGAIISFQKLRLSNEIMIARTSGLSLIRLIFAPSVFAFGFAIFALIVIDPIASATSKRYENMEREVFGASGRNLSVSTEGIWFRDQTPNLSVIIHGEAIGSDYASITKPTLYSFDSNLEIIARYYPDELLLKEGYWELQGGFYMARNGKITPIEGRQIQTTLRQRDLSHSNKKPETIPIFELWNYIEVLERAGLPTLGHASYLYSQLALPFVLIGMVMIVGRFTLSFTKRSGWTHLVTFSLVSGLLFYFIKDFLYVMGTSGRLSPFVAGFAPGMIMICLGTVLLMRADDG